MYRKKPIRKKRRHIGRIIGLILFLCLMAGSAYFLFFSPFLMVKEINISADNDIFEPRALEIVQENLSGKEMGLIPQRNIIFVPVEKIRAGILSIASEIESVDINKKIPSLLEINVANHRGAGVWCRAEREEENKENEFSLASSSDEIIKKKEKLNVLQCFNIDGNGVIYQEAPLISGSLILTIYDSRNKSDDWQPKLKDLATSAEIMDFIIETKKMLSDNLNIKVDNFEIISESDLTAKTSERWIIYFNCLNSAEGQAESLGTVLREIIKDSRRSLEYVDLRIDGRVYYK